MSKYILFLFLIVGCHPSIRLHSNVAIDSTFTQDQLADIITATEEWKNTTGGLVDLNTTITNHPEEYGNDTLKILYSADPGVDSDPVIVYGHTEFIISVDSIIIYPNRIAKSTAPLKEVVLHELGHTLGLHHVSEGLMTPIVNGINCIDNVTLNQFCSIHNCDDSTIKTDCE